MLAKRFALRCLRNDRFKDLFPRKQNDLDLRSGGKFIERFCKGRRLQKSSIPEMQKLLNRNKWDDSNKNHIHQGDFIEFPSGDILATTHKLSS